MMRASLLVVPLVVDAGSLLSATFGDHMVLQRAPQQALLFGSTTPGSTVTTNFDEQTFTAEADVKGTWRQKLPAMPASKKAYDLNCSSSAGDAASLTDVLFGDVYMCGGQSNMQFSMMQVANRTAEVELADQYPTIRLFTVGQSTESDVPLEDLQTIEQRWSIASKDSIEGKNPDPANGWGYFSAVCWLFGRRISDALSSTGEVPIGLISNNRGGTKIQQWSPPAVLEGCGEAHRPSFSRLYNAMIHPYTVGPMAISGFAWYQGESNSESKQTADQYACLFPAMISQWREAFRNPTAYFGFVQLSTYCRDGIAEMREAQMAALKLPNVAYATNADHGLGCTAHPRDKQFCGKRLGDSALAVKYGSDVHWRSPTYLSATSQVSGAVVNINVSLLDVSNSGLTTDVYPANYVDGLNCTGNTNCTWAGIQVEGVGWLNATVTATLDSKLVLRAILPSTTGSVAKVVATAYGWGPIPLMNAYDLGTNLPVLPWKRNITETVSFMII